MIYIRTLDTRKRENEMKLTREFYQPQGAIIETVDGLPGSEIHRYETNGAIYAAVFGGKRAKPDFHFRFKTEEQRETRIAYWVGTQKERAKYAAEQRAKRNGGHSLKVGDVLHSSWGYDQTNADFYQVVEVPSKCFVIVREIGYKTVSDNGPSTRVVPVKDSFKTDPKRYKAGPNNSISVASYANANKTDWEDTHHVTGWGYGH